MLRGILLLINCSFYFITSESEKFLCSEKIFNVVFTRIATHIRKVV